MFLIIRQRNDKLTAWMINEKEQKISLFGCFHFSSSEESNIEVAMDGTQILVGEIVRECLAALKCVQVQMHYI